MVSAVIFNPLSDQSRTVIAEDEHKVVAAAVG